ncbi:MAG: PAS domain S-box protein [Bryobacteraceae bacterium]|nr:PAS domain S-box protein [Bryobacteraceae bacterium]
MSFLLGALPHVFWISRPAERRLVYVSPSYAELWGKPCELLYENFEEWVQSIHEDDRARVVQAFASLTVGDAYEAEYRIVRPDGSVRWIHDRGKRTSPGSGEAAGLAEDITSRKQAEIELAASEARWRSLAQSIPVGVFRAGREGRIDFANRKWFELTGLPPGEEDQWPSRVHPDDSAQVAAERDRAHREHVARSVEFRFLQPDGAVITVLGQFTPQFDAQGQFSGVTGTLADLTESRRAHDAAQASRADLMALLDLLPLGFFQAEVNGRSRFLSRRFLELTGYAAGLGEVKNFNAWDYVEPDEAAHLRKLIEHQRTGETVEAHFRYRNPKSGEPRWLEARWTLQPALGETPPTLFGVLDDVTERRNQQEALRRSEDRARLTLSELQAVYDTAPVGLCVLDREMRWVRINQWLARMNGLSSREHIGRRVQELLPGIAEAVEAYVRQVFETGYPVLDVQLTGEARPGEAAPVWRASYVPIRGTGGAVRAVNVTAEEISEQMRGAERLREAEQRARKTLAELEAIYDTAPVGLCVLDRDLRYVRINSRLAEMNGIAAEEHLGRTVRDIVPVLADTVEGWVREIFETGEPKLGVVLKGQTPAKPGVERIWMENWLPVRDAQGNIFAVNVTAEEITDAVRQEEALRRMNEDLKQFAYAASHDLQEPLRSVVTFSQLFERQYRAQVDEQGAYLLKTVVEAGLRMEQMLRDLRDYWQNSEARPGGLSVVDLQEVCAAAVENCQAAIDASGARVMMEGVLPEVQGESMPLTQLMQNLISNALKYRDPNRPPRVRISASREENDWIVSVADNGLGIPAEHRDAVFKVFKRLHGHKYPGTGMGLAICQKIVERFGGRIWVEEAAGGGSVFRFRLRGA